MKKATVLIMHGMTPKDFPLKEKREYMKLRSKYHDAALNPEDAQSVKFFDLETKIRNWPRNKGNDPFYAAALQLGKDLESLTSQKVLVGFNEFCAPSATQVLESAAQGGWNEVIVATPMLTPGGHHSEEEIPQLIAQVQEKHNGVVFRYAWPFESLRIAGFLADHIEHFDKTLV